MQTESRKRKRTLEDGDQDYEPDDDSGGSTVRCPVKKHECHLYDLYRSKWWVQFLYRSYPEEKTVQKLEKKRIPFRDTRIHTMLPSLTSCSRHFQEASIVLPTHCKLPQEILLIWGAVKGRSSHWRSVSMKYEATVALKISISSWDLGLLHLILHSD